MFYVHDISPQNATYRLFGRDVVTVVAGASMIRAIRDLARNEEFSEIAVINIFFTVLKKNQLSVGGGSCRENVDISHPIDM